MTYKEIVINDFKELQTLNFPEYWNFRGQTQDWKLKTSIEVLLDSHNLDYYWYIDERTNFRQEFIDKFKLATNLNDLQDSTCLALMQHYGLKTELLDVTTSLNIALYFAAENDYDKDGVIWAFNLAQLYKNNTENGFVINQNHPNSKYVRFDYSSKLITEIGRNSNFVMSVNLHDYQKYINTRIKKQKGRFFDSS